jgi:hypothetical protein
MRGGIAAWMVVVAARWRVKDVASLQLWLWMIGADEDGEAVPPAFNLVVVFLQAGPASPGQVDGWIVGLHGPAPRATKRGIFPHPTFIRSSVFLSYLSHASGATGVPPE